MISKYIVYGKQNCPFCDKAKYLLTKENLPFEYNQIETQEDKEYLMQLMSKFNVIPRTVPQIISIGIDANMGYIGGYEQLVKFIEINKEEIVNAV